VTVPPAVSVGVDTLCWHLRLERGALTVADVLDEAAELGADCLGVNLHHLRRLDLDAHRALADRAAAAGMALIASGDFVGAARNGDDPADGVARVASWVERASALGSPYLRLASGFYRAELAGRPDLIEAERRHVVAVLQRALAAADDAGVTLLLENHSDFTADEYVSIVDELGDGRIGVFLDLINPMAALEDPLPVIARLAPLARAGHVKDYELVSIQTDDAYHRRGFEVRYRYPGEGVADLRGLVRALLAGLPDREYHLTIEGLDNTADLDDQRRRLAPALSLLRQLIDEERPV
jgi:sugar phosphate isomerase/epimerase